MSNIIQVIAVTVATIFMCSCSQPKAITISDLAEPIPIVEETVEVKMEPIHTSPETFSADISTDVIVKEEPLMSKEDIELIALVTMAEAEGECEEGKRLVIDTILNRVDSEYFPNTVSGVVYQSGQFTSMTNGRADRCYVSDYICQLVEEELQSRTNNEVMFFHANDYGAYGTPMFPVGNHYFSSY